MQEISEKPVLVNRAPSLWRSNMVAAYPVLVSGKVLKVQPLGIAGLGLDFDGDAESVFLPISPKAVQEARGMTLRTNFFSDKIKDDLLVKPSQEPVLGMWSGTMHNSSAKVHSYANKAAAWKDFLAGKLTLNSKVKLKNNAPTELTKTSSAASQAGLFATGTIAGFGFSVPILRKLHKDEAKRHQAEEFKLLTENHLLSQKLNQPSILDKVRTELQFNPKAAKIRIPVGYKIRKD